ncbi:choline dehydrogenase 7 [Perkinsus chesapeaki]|uniref:Choline dehydrogenase 7 n=1 Tax=Perkinsus chesapeaki TaxID=330153 RepID=A0A7J6MZ56_PERCH|nr:choline dehydrogenase 7 [Perkinsus chesapeaki]
MSPRKSVGIHSKSDRLLDNLIERDIIKGEWLQMDSVLTFNEDKEWLVKWRALPLTQATWEHENDIPEDLLTNWRNINNKKRKVRMKAIMNRPKDASDTWYNNNIEDDNNNKVDDNTCHKYYYKPIDEQLFDFQVQGVQWLLYNWSQSRGSILADEMGLGKTVQSSVFISAVHDLTGGVGPCLVVAPLSTLGHWKRELAKWAPALHTVVFHGSQHERPLIQDYIINWVDINTGKTIKEKNAAKGDINYKPKFDVVVASYETVIQTPSAFNCYHWRLMIMDEGHRLKGVDSLAKQVICDRNKMKVDHHLLLTGTPIQNNLQELWSVLNVVDRKTFNNWDVFYDKYGSVVCDNDDNTDGDDNTAAANELVNVMKPYILRRHKTDVMKQVPPKEEVVISVEFTRMQRKVYKSIYERSFCQLAAADAGGGIIDTSQYKNICMQLRKCLAHPYLLDNVEEEHIRAANENSNISSHDELVMKSLIEMSGKMVFIDKLLPRLIETKQKALIFSQMTRALDVIEDYLLYKGYKYERLDGNVSGVERQEAIDRFNATPYDDNNNGVGGMGGASQASQPWVFLLSTRAGGVGINLTAANVVIIYDSDWNPQNDMQAQARCHRIGQSKEVKVYRLITRNSYEERMFDVASKKLGLEQALMSGVTKNSKLELSRKELQDLIKRGAYAAFESGSGEDDDTSKAEGSFMAATIDDILSGDRAKTVKYGTVVAGGQRSAFSKATFVANEADLIKDDDENDKTIQQQQEEGESKINVDDADFWRKLAGDDFDKLISQGLVTDPGKRRKEVISYVQPSWADYKRMDEGGGGGRAANRGEPTYAEQLELNKIMKLGSPWNDKDTRHRLREFLTAGAYGQWSAMRSYIIGSKEASNITLEPSPSSSKSSYTASSPTDTPYEEEGMVNDDMDESAFKEIMISFIGLIIVGTLVKVIAIRAEHNIIEDDDNGYNDDDSDYKPDGAASSIAGSSNSVNETLLDQLEWLFDLNIMKRVIEDVKSINDFDGNERCWHRLWGRIKAEFRKTTNDVDDTNKDMLNGIGALITGKVKGINTYLFPQWGRLIDGSMKNDDLIDDYINQAADDAERMLYTMDALHGIVTMVSPSIPNSDVPFIITSSSSVDVAGSRGIRVGTRIEAFHRVDEEWQEAILKGRLSNDDHYNGGDGICEVEWLNRKDQYHRFIKEGLIRRIGDNDTTIDISNEPKWMKRAAIGAPAAAAGSNARSSTRQWWTTDDDRELIGALCVMIPSSSDTTTRQQQQPSSSCIRSKVDGVMMNEDYDDDIKGINIRGDMLLPKELLNQRDVKEWCSWIIDSIVPRSLQSYCSPTGVLKLTKAYLNVLRCSAKGGEEVFHNTTITGTGAGADEEPITSIIFEDAGLPFADTTNDNNAKMPSQPCGSNDILSYLIKMCTMCGMEKSGDIAIRLTKVIIEGIDITRGGFEYAEMMIIRKAFIPFKNAASVMEGKIKADVARRRKIDAEPPVSEKWGSYGRAEAMVKIIRKLGIPQQLWIIFIDILKEYRPCCNSSRTKVGFRKPLNDKSDHITDDDDDDGKFDASSAWDYIFNNSEGIKSDKALQGRFIGCTKLKPWSKAVMEELGSTITRKSPCIKAQDCIDFTCVYLWELAMGLRGQKDDLEMNNINNPFKELMFIPFNSGDINIQFKRPFPLLGKDDDSITLIDEFEELQVKANLQGVFGKFPNPPSNQTKIITLEDIFRRKLDELLERLNNFTIIHQSTNDEITLPWWKREIHDRALIACVIVHGMPSGWDDKVILGNEDELPFLYWAKKEAAMLQSASSEGSNSINARSRRRRCNDGSIKQPGTLAHKAYTYLINTVKPALRDRIIGITAQIELAAKNKAAKNKTNGGNKKQKGEEKGTNVKMDDNNNISSSSSSTSLSHNMINRSYNIGLELVSMMTNNNKEEEGCIINQGMIAKRKRQDLFVEGSSGGSRASSIPSPDYKRPKSVIYCNERITKEASEEEERPYTQQQQQGGGAGHHQMPVSSSSFTPSAFSPPTTNWSGGFTPSIGRGGGGGTTSVNNNYYDTNNTFTIPSYNTIQQQPAASMPFLNTSSSPFTTTTTAVPPNTTSFNTPVHQPPATATAAVGAFQQSNTQKKSKGGKSRDDFEVMVNDLRTSYTSWLDKTEASLNREENDLNTERNDFEQEKRRVWKEFVDEKNKGIMKLKEDRRRADAEMQNQLKQIKTERADTRRKIEADKQRFNLERDNTLRTLTLKEDALTADKNKLDEERKRMADQTLAIETKVDVNVGGTVFETSRGTLMRQQGSLLEGLASGRIESQRDRQGRIFIDRDAESFRHLLGFLRNPEVLDVGNQCWRPCRPMNTERTYFGSAGFNSRLYVFGGQNLDYKALCESEVYDALRDTWMIGASLNTPRRNCASTITEDDGRIFAIGGYDGSSMLSSVEAYDPRMRNWMNVASMSTPRSSCMAVADNNGHIWALGGTSGKRLKSIEMYDIRNNKWSSIPGTDMIEEVSAGSAVFFNGHIYVIGGTDNTQLVHSSVESLSISNIHNGWNYKHQAGTERMDCCAAPVMDSILLGGGQNGGEAIDWKAGHKRECSVITTLLDAGMTAQQLSDCFLAWRVASDNNKYNKAMSMCVLSKPSQAIALTVAQFLSILTSFSSSSSLSSSSGGISKIPSFDTMLGLLEICHSYVELTLPSWKRKDILKRDYEFICHCIRCDNNENVHVGSEDWCMVQDYTGLRIILTDPDLCGTNDICPFGKVFRQEASSALKRAWERLYSGGELMDCFSPLSTTAAAAAIATGTGTAAGIATGIATGTAAIATGTAAGIATGTAAGIATGTAAGIATATGTGTAAGILPEGVKQLPHPTSTVYLLGSRHDSSAAANALYKIEEDNHHHPKASSSSSSSLALGLELCHGRINRMRFVNSKDIKALWQFSHTCKSSLITLHALDVSPGEAAKEVYGFYDECIRKFGNATVWRVAMDLFDNLPLAAIAFDVFAVHGGLSPDLGDIDQIRLLQRVQEVPPQGPLADLVWSDPDASVKGWELNPRGAGLVFGAEPTRQFLHQNGLRMVARAHQLVQEGYKFMFPASEDPKVVSPGPRPSNVIPPVPRIAATPSPFPMTAAAAATTTTTTTTTIKDNIEWSHNVKVTCIHNNNDEYMKNIINDIGVLCDIEFKGDNVMQDKIMRHNAWRLSIAMIIPSIKLGLNNIKKGDKDMNESGSMLAGFMVYRIDGSKRELHIGQMAVVEEYRGMGVGGAAIRILKDMAKSPKCPVDRLVCSSLPGAIKFYKKNGFRKVQKLDIKVVDDGDGDYIEGQWRMEWIVRNTNEDRLRKRQSLWQQGRRHHHQREGISNVEEEDYKVGDDIWIPKDDDGMFEMAKIVSIPKPFNGDIKIRTKSTTTSTSSSIGRERIVNISEIYESNGGNIEVDTIKDVSQMAIVNEPIVNDIIKRRYLNDIIYTSARPMLILVNPFRDLNNTTSPIASYYRDMVPDEGQIEQSPPHIFRIAAQALTAYYVNGGIISRDDINDDGMFSGRGSSSVYDDQSLTGLNDNVVVDDDGGKGGGNVSILISGESGAGKTELLRGGSPELLGIDGLDLNPHTETYKVLNNTLSTITGVDDAMEYQNTMNAMIALGIDNRQRFDICRVLGGILHGGEIEWIDSKDEDRIGYNKNNNGGGGNISDINKGEIE